MREALFANRANDTTDDEIVRSVQRDAIGEGAGSGAARRGEERAADYRMGNWTPTARIRLMQVQTATVGPPRAGALQDSSRSAGAPHRQDTGATSKRVVPVDRRTSSPRASAASRTLVLPTTRAAPTWAGCKSRVRLA